MAQKKSEKDLFNQLKTNFLDFDPSHFVKNNLTLDGAEFNVLDNGWKFMSDIYRYIALQATRPDGKPVVIKKGRQVGATMMGGALDLYFTNSGLFSNPNIRVIHLFPALGQVKKFSQDKLENLIRTAKDDLISKNKLDSPNSVDNLTMKQFNTGTLWIDSLGADGDRIRGMTVDVSLFDECFPYGQQIEICDGKIKIGKLFDMFKEGKDLPSVLTFNENSKQFEYKRVLKAWNRGHRELVQVKAGKWKIKCTNNHKFLTRRGWVQAADLSAGDLLKSRRSDDLGLSIVSDIPVVEVTGLSRKEVVYDIEVEDNHNFILAKKTGASDGGPIAHNCQDMLAHAIGNATKILTAAKYGPIGQGVQVYFGTPKNKGTHFETIWGISDQRYYHLGCINCRKTYPFYLPEDNRWQSIWLYENTVQCPLCGTKQKKIEAIELGKWVGSKPYADCDFVGFHINQLYIPYFTKENIEKLMPENNPAQTERLWKNEVLGEFYSGAGAPLTKTEVYQLCRDPDRYFSKSIKASEKRTYLGSDWGGKDDDPSASAGQSFSCVVVLSAQADGTLLIEHAHKLKRNTFDFKKDTINEMYRRFEVTRGVSDWFFGQDVVSTLQMSLGNRFLGAQGSGSLITPMKYRPDELIISYNKDLLIDELIELFRKGKVRFPWKSYEYLEWLIDHCTSMESKIKITGGQPMKTYVKGNSPNDGFMALMYAYMAYKFDITNGFTIKPGLKRESEYPKAVIANVKRRI